MVDFGYIVVSLFRGLHSVCRGLIDFISNPLGYELVNAPILSSFFDLTILDVQVFAWLRDFLLQFFPYSIIESLPVFILVGITFSIIKHFI